MTPDASMTPRHRTKSFPHKAGIALAVLLLTVSAGWLARVQILRGAARVWIVSDSLVPADAVAVLGGGLETRPFAAADLYKKGMVRQILISAVKPGPPRSSKSYLRTSSLIAPCSSSWASHARPS